ncbi:uncharacterized protein LOC111257993 [Setaria italica]|nr:uncharacterized protein LOC111257993 [Setaria italica]
MVQLGLRPGEVGTCRASKPVFAPPPTPRSSSLAEQVNYSPKKPGNLASLACRYIFHQIQHAPTQQNPGHSPSQQSARSPDRSERKHFRDSVTQASMPRHLALRLHAIAAALPASSGGHGHPGAAVAAVAAFLALCALALALCASHSAPGPGRLRRALASVSRRRTEPVIAAVHQVQPGGGEASPCVWQRGILMGGKCQLPDFSGVINYDPAGNLVAPARPGRAVPALGW